MIGHVRLLKCLRAQICAALVVMVSRSLLEETTMVTSPVTSQSTVTPGRWMGWLRPIAHAAGLAAAIIAGIVVVVAPPAQAQQPPAGPKARIIVIGEGSVAVVPDYAEVRSGVTTRARTAKEAADANTKAMTAMMAALKDLGVEQKDIQTSRFSVQPVYAPPQPNAEPKLTGFSVSNQVAVTVRQIAAAGTILDRLIGSGATDVGGIEFLHADLSTALDHAREAAFADARRKAELYARAAGLSLGRVAWITEDPAYAPPMQAKAVRAGTFAAAAPIAAGEDTLHVRITVGFATGL
jgi:uncharacterized protein